MSVNNQMIPKGWKTISIGSCFLERRKSSIKVDDAANYGPFPFFTSGDSVLQHTSPLVSGENLFLATGGVANVKYYCGDASFSTDTYTITAKEGIDTKYLYYHLLYLRDYINTNFFLGSGLKHLKKKEFKDFVIAIPSNIDEQRRIADTLSKIDEAINKTESLIDKYELIRKGLISDLLHRGITAGHLRCKDVSLYTNSAAGTIPIGWDCLMLKQICSAIEDCPHSTPDYIDYGVYVARTFCIKDGEYLYDSSSYVSESEYKKRISRIRPQAGDIIFTREAPIGEAFVIPEGVTICLGQRVMLLRHNDKLNPQYFVYYNYGDDMQSLYRSIVGGTTVNHLNVKDVKNLWIPLPLRDEQDEIVKKINEISGSIRALKDENIKTSLVREGLLKDLITGKILV